MTVEALVAVGTAVMGALIISWRAIFRVGKADQSIDNLGEKIDDLSSCVHSIQDRLDSMDRRLAFIEGKLDIGAYHHE